MLMTYAGLTWWVINIYRTLALLLNSVALFALVSSFFTFCEIMHNYVQYCNCPKTILNFDVNFDLYVINCTCNATSFLNISLHRTYERYHLNFDYLCRILVW